MSRTVLDRSEAGYTLVEILMAIAVTAIIVAPLTNAMVVGLRTSGRTATVLVTSADRQMLANYLPLDALSAKSATVDSLPTGCLDVDGTRVVLMTWNEFDGTTTSYAADYRLVPVGTQNTLVRYWCVLGSPAELVTVAHDVAPAPDIPSVSIAAGKVALTVTDSLGAQYTVSGTRRAA
jgi:prepilin-type N-terminal cleavage/methylation domain-containing protein